ncbi:MAG: class I SAM-dependent methyltransferase [Bacteroidales bacterium]|nr:class I SAM-dependent methyltransferase [Bacteroidales bacterium]
MGRIENEKKHGEYLAEHGAEQIWNWSSPAGQRRWERRVKMLTDGIRPEHKVLELGCGTGDFTKEIIKTGADITAIDISPVLLDIARRNISAENVRFVEDNAYQMSFADNSFDFVIGSSVLHHLEIEKAVAEIFRVLKPNGVMLFTEPNMMNPQIALQKNIPYIKRKMGDSPDETAFFRWRMAKLLKQNQFANVSVRPFDFLHPSVPRKLIKVVSKVGNAFEKCPLIKEIAGSVFISAKKGTN